MQHTSQKVNLRLFPNKYVFYSDHGIFVGTNASQNKQPSEMELANWISLK